MSHFCMYMQLFPKMDSVSPPLESWLDFCFTNTVPVLGPALKGFSSFSFQSPKLPRKALSLLMEREDLLITSHSSYPICGKVIMDFLAPVKLQTECHCISDFSQQCMEQMKCLADPPNSDK